MKPFVFAFFAVSLALEQLRASEKTILLARDAKFSGSLQEHRTSDPAHIYWVSGWTSTAESFTWEVFVSGDEPVLVLVDIVVCSQWKMGGSSAFQDKVPTESEPPPVLLTLRNNSTGQFLKKEIPFRDELLVVQWEREELGNVTLQTGVNILFLTAAQAWDGKSNFDLALQSLELFSEKVQFELAEVQQSVRASTTWMREAQLGLFFHWNSKSMPRRGEQRSYEEAVDSFDVDKLARFAKDVGAGVVVFTTTWAGYYFPGPIEAIDEILPGRTTRRDLILDLSHALEKENIRLILYYHYGKDDAEWWSRTGFSKRDKEEFWNGWVRIIEEVGERYGSRLHGWWIDDAFTGYYGAFPPWQKLIRATKRGYGDRVVGWNTWVYPPATNFGDFFTGEIGIADSVHLSKWLGDASGILDGGPHRGLQATFCGLMEPGEWTHIEANFDPPAPLLSLNHVTKVFAESRARGMLPIVNVRITQEGYIGDATRRLLMDAKKKLQEVGEVNHVPGGGVVVRLGSETATASNDLIYWSQHNSLCNWSERSTVNWTLDLGRVGSVDLIGEVINVTLYVSCECDGISHPDPKMTISLSPSASATISLQETENCESYRPFTSFIPMPQESIVTVTLSAASMCEIAFQKLEFWKF